MAEALLRLASEPELNFSIPREAQTDPALAAGLVLHQLEAFMRRNAETLRERLAGHADRMSTDESRLPAIEPRVLVIFDNVDQTSLLAADQVRLLPQTEWFETIVTTRLDPKRFGAARGGRPFQAIAVDALPIHDAVALVREFQETGTFASPEDEDGARALVESLGGFTLAVELVAAYLGAHPEVRPAAYLARLGRDGLPTADKLAEDADVADVIEHREKQLGIVLAATLARLSGRAKFVAQSAALLAPDFVVMDWLKEVAANAFPELAGPSDPSRPDPWLETWRELHGLRLLTPSDDAPIEADPHRRGTEVPRLARMHRLVADHLKAGLTEEVREALGGALIGVIFADQARFEHTWQHDATGQAWLLRPLGENALHLRKDHPNSRELAITCGVAGQAELQVGLLQRAEVLIEAFAETLRARHEADPDDEEAARLHSAALNKLGDFLSNRGLPGDAERALSCYERSLEVREGLLASNPASGQAARDVSVSLDRLGDFLSNRGLPGDADRALACYERGLEVRERLLAANPASGQAARDVSVSHFKFFDFHRQRGDERAAMASLAACFGILEDFARRGRPMDAQMRGLHAQLRPIFAGGS